MPANDLAEDWWQLGNLLLAFSLSCNLMLVVMFIWRRRPKKKKKTPAPPGPARAATLARRASSPKLCTEAKLDCGVLGGF